MMFLKMAPMKGGLRFGRKSKLSPRFIGHFEILDRIEIVTYRTALGTSLLPKCCREIIKERKPHKNRRMK